MVVAAPALPSRVRLLLVFAVSFVAVLFRSPWPTTVLQDADQCLQLAGAQMVDAGLHPFVNFGADYGPLVFYVSWLDQKLGGHSVAAELLTDALLYAVAYALLYASVSLLSRRQSVALLVTLLALVQLPRFYKYYILLGPSLSLLSVLLYVDRPTLRRLVGVAFCTVVTGLFRPDMGAYAVAGAAVAIALSRTSWTGAVRQAIVLAGLMLLLASPWLAFLLARHGLTAYLRDSTIIAASHADGLSRPIPRIHLHTRLRSPENLEAMAYLVWWAVPVLGTVTIVLAWRRLTPVERRRAIVAVVAAGLCLAQSVHRTGYGHLIQSIAPAYAVAAFALDQAMCLPTRWLRSTLAAAAAALAAVSLAAGVAQDGLRWPAVKTFVNFKRYYFCDRREMARRVGVEMDRRIADDLAHHCSAEKSTNAEVLLVRYIDAHTGPADPVLFVDYLTHLSYFTGRPAAGAQIFVAPGFFSAERDQRAMIDALKAQHSPMVVESLAGYDGNAAKQFRSYEPLVFAYIRSNYHEVSDPTLPPGYVVWLANR